VPPSPATSVQYATSIGYDALNRPTAVTWNPAPAAVAPTAGGVTFNHAYNRANQRIGQTATDNSWLNYPAATASTVSYSADVLNRYIAVGAVNPTYDGNSNLTFDGTFSFGYDAENRLISASGAGNTAAYAYDAQGRRKTKTVNGTTTVFVTDAGNREVLEYDGASGAIQRWYAYGLGSNDVLNQSNVVAGTRAALIPDIQGSVIASLDSGTGTLSKIGYLPYGKSASVSTPFGYTGQRIDPETNGLYYYRARHYSPAWGRFLQSDPIGYGGGLNLYAYVNNDPLNLLDPFGMSADSPSYGKSLLQGTVNAVPGAYYSGLAQQQFNQGNYGAAAIYAGVSILDAGVAALTLGASTEVGTGIRAAETALSDLAIFRSQLELAPGQGTLARLDISGQSFYGINAHGQDIRLSVNAISATHAEADVFQQAANAGINGGSGLLTVDRSLCLACGQNGGVSSMARQLGLDSLTIQTPGSIRTIVP
jgi:RHS repeat-associated protein